MFVIFNEKTLNTKIQNNKEIEQNANETVLSGEATENIIKELRSERDTNVAFLQRFQKIVLQT